MELPHEGLFAVVKLNGSTSHDGVYIRAFARDTGEKLGVGAYLSRLIRTRV